MRKLTKRRVLRNITVILLIILIGYLIKDNFLNNKAQMRDVKYEKILLIGIDGMDPKIVDKLMSEGKLPNFKRLKEQGGYTTLGTSLPPHSPVA